MGTLGANSLDLPASAEQENLGIKTLHLHLLLFTGLQRQRADPLQLELLRHDSRC